MCDCIKKHEERLTEINKRKVNLYKDNGNVLIPYYYDIPSVTKGKKRITRFIRLAKCPFCGEPYKRKEN